MHRRRSRRQLDLRSRRRLRSHPDVRSRHSSCSCSHPDFHHSPHEQPMHRRRSRRHPDLRSRGRSHSHPDRTVGASLTWLAYSRCGQRDLSEMRAQMMVLENTVRALQQAAAGQRDNTTEVAWGRARPSVESQDPASRFFSVSSPPWPCARRVIGSAQPQPASFRDSGIEHSGGIRCNLGIAAVVATPQCF